MDFQIKIQSVNSDTVITTGANARFPNGRYRHGIGGIKRGEEDRRVDSGPMVAGPWAYAYGLCWAITANPDHSTGAESERNRDAGTEFAVRTGDLLEFEGEVYQVETFRNEEFVNLHRMSIKVVEGEDRMVRDERDLASRSRRYKAQDFE